jgi:FimV-like protein
MQPAKQSTSKQRRITTTLPAAVLLVVSTLMSFATEAAALGDEVILSQLGDPVEVEITVAEWEDIDLDQLQISAGTPEVYESFGLTYPPALQDLNFNLIGPSLDGEVKVLVSSREPMHEPYLQLLLVMRWPGGSLLREYVLLFDPPQISQTAPSVNEQGTPPSTAPVAIPATEVVERSEPVPDVASASQPQQNQIPATTVDSAAAVVAVQEDEPVPAAAPVSTQQGGTYTVESGDNLWDIASRLGPPNADLYQILLSTYQLNRGSFVNGNISLLKYGVTLRLPTSADIAAIDPVTAKTLFDQLWNEGSERIGMAERGEPLPPVRSILLPEVTRSEVNPTAFVPGDAGTLPAEGNSGESGVAPTGALVATIGAGPAQNAAPGLPGAPGPTTLAVVPLAPAVDNAGIPIPQASTDDATAVTSGNPYLDRINTSAQFMQEMLRAKRQQIELLETQMAAMNTRMLEISRVTERLSTSLDEVLAERDRRRASDWQSTFLLGGLILGLSLVVIAIIVMALRLAAQIRVQHALLQTAIQSRPPVAARADASVVVPASVQSPSEDSDQTAKVQKQMAPEQALSVSIIEEEAETPGANSSDTIDTKSEMNPSNAELNAELGARELNESEKPASQ